jgi:hypothetical protein
MTLYGDPHALEAFTGTDRTWFKIKGKEVRMHRRHTKTRYSTQCKRVEGLWERVQRGAGDTAGDRVLCRRQQASSAIWQRTVMGHNVCVSERDTGLLVYT